MPALNMNDTGTRKVAGPAYRFGLRVEDSASAVRIGLFYGPAVIMSNDENFVVFSHFASLTQVKVGTPANLKNSR